MTHEQMLEIARGNVERHLGDVAGEYDLPMSKDTMYDEVYTLAFDALVDKGVSHHEAGEVASELANSYANP